MNNDTKEATDAYNWVVAVINSCQNSFHLDGANKLISLFWKRFRNRQMADELRGLYYSQLAQIFR